VASHLFTDENEYYWTDHTGKPRAPPWHPGQQVVFKLKPWSKENTAERQQKRPGPPPSDEQDPLGRFSHFTPPSPPSLTGEAGAAVVGAAPSTTEGAADQIGQYHSLTRPRSTRQVIIKVEVEGRSVQVKVDPKG
jgi:hypothetical protein